eukprot:5888598-Karenia_brevis.AAC.1
MPSIPEEKRGPLLRNCFSGAAAVCKLMLDSANLTEDGRIHLVDTIRSKYIAGKDAVFWYRLTSYLRSYQKIVDIDDDYEDADDDDEDEDNGRGG